MTKNVLSIGYAAYIQRNGSEVKTGLKRRTIIFFLISMLATSVICALFMLGNLDEEMKIFAETKGKSSLSLGGVVTHSECGISVCKFVYGKCDKRNDKSYEKGIKSILNTT
jgi:hypothetical protein